MPTRMVREGFLDSAAIVAAGEPAEVLYHRLLLVVDDYARYDGRPDRIWRACWPAGTSQELPALEDVGRRLDRLVALELVLRYETGGKPYIVIPKFGQRMRAKRSRFPDPPASVLLRIAQLESGVAPAKPGPKPAPNVPQRETTTRATKPQIVPSSEMPDTCQSDDGRMSVTCRPESESESEVESERNITVTNQGASPDLSTNAGHMPGIRQASPKQRPAGNPGARAPNGQLPPGWDETPDGIEEAGLTLSMSRLPFETDQDYAARIHARLSL